VADIDGAACEHHRQKRREGEPPDAERNRQHDGAADRGIARGVAGGGEERNSSGHENAIGNYKTPADPSLTDAS